MAIAAGLGRHGWFDFGPFRWKDVRPGSAARAAIGVVTPLAIGLATHHLVYGAFAAIGALPAGLASFQGVSRTRVATVGLSAVGMAVSTFVGGTVAAAAPWALVPVVAVWAYIVGLMAALGPRAGIAGLHWAMALLIATAIPLGPGEAAVRAALALAGGLWQGVLVVLSWAIRRGSVERAAVATSYRVLSDYAAELAAGARVPAPALAFQGTEVLRDPNPLMRTHLRLLLLALLAEAERLRLTLAAVAQELAHTPPASGTPWTLREAAGALADIADALDAGRQLRPRYLDRLRQRLAATPDAGWAVAALLGQLRGAMKIIDHLDGEALEESPDAASTQLRAPVKKRATFPHARLTLQAALSPSSAVGRHAVRVAAVAGAGELFAQASQVFRGYWIALTIILVLRPDYTSTFYRGVQRSIGTALGVALGVATVQLAHIGHTALIVGLAVVVALAYTTFDVSFLLFNVFLAGYVVVILALLGIPATSTAVARLADTAIGAALALVAYLLWPTWEGTSAQEKLADVVEAEGRYATALLRAYVSQDVHADAKARKLQIAARRARNDAEASADRLADEPTRPPMTAGLAHELVASVRRFVYPVLALDAVVAQRRAAMTAQSPGVLPQAKQPELDDFAAGLETAMRQLAAALRALEPPQPLPPLRELQQALATKPADDAFRTATDGLVDATNTTADILRRGLRRELSSRL
jgi:uncharacterized membrane protein YccC